MLFDAEGVHPYPEKVEAIRAIQVPQDAQELQSFLGIATYMVPLFPNLSTLSKPRVTCLRRALTSTGPLPTVQLLKKSSSLSAVMSHLRILI